MTTPNATASPAPFRTSLSMLGWALNEEENIGGYIERAEALLRGLAADFELILIDDGSTDRTAAIVEEYQKTRPWLRLHRNGGNRGSGYNTKKAISLATKDHVFWQTVDWSYDLSALPDALPLLATHDVLQGARVGTVSVGGLLSRRSDTPYKGLVSITNYLLIRLLFRLPVHDYQNVTVYPRRLIQAIPLQSESAFTNPECLLKAWWRGASIHEFPVPFLKRERGSAKGTRPIVVLRSIRDVFYWWLRWVVLGERGESRPGPIRYWDERKA